MKTSKTNNKSISHFFKSDEYEFLLVYFNFLYYVGFSPFGYHFDWNQHKYTSVTSKFRKVISALLQLLSLMSLLSCVRSVTPTLNFKKDPLVFFDVFTQSGFVIIYLPSLIYIVWTKQSSFEKLMEISLSTTTTKTIQFVHSASNKKRKNMIYACIIIAVAICLLLLNEILFNFAVPEGTDRNSVYGIIRGLAGMMYYNLYLQDKSIPLDENKEMSWYSISCVLIYSALIQYASSICFLFEQVPMLATLTIYSASNKMKTVMRNNASNLETEVLEEYFWHKEFVKTLNSIISPAFLAIFFATMPIFPKMILDILDGSDYFALTFLPFTMLYIFLAAKSSKRYEDIKTWILETKEEFMNSNSYVLIGVFSEASCEPLGLSVGGITQISYKFIATALGLLITYAVVILQFSTNSHKNFD